MLRPTVIRPLGARLFSRTPSRAVFEMFGKKQPPGYIVGTVNDAAELNAPDRVHGTNHWLFERATVIAFAPLISYALIKGTLPPLADASLGFLLVSHCHFGLGACITDYVPKRLFPKLSPLCFMLLGAGSAAGLYGIYKLETEENGLVGAVSTLWHA